MLVSVLAALSLAVAADQPGNNPQLSTGADVQQAAESEGPVLQLEATDAPGSEIVRESAGEYAAYHRVIADLHSAPIGSGEDLDQAMDSLTAFYGEDRLVRAWIAYAAIIAARHPEYLDEVSELADYYGPQAAMSGLMYDPGFATSFSTADNAEASVVEVIQQDTSQIREVGERYRTAAYDLQSQRWANRRAGDRQARLAALASIGERPITVPDDVQITLASNYATGLPASELFEYEDAVLPAGSVGPQLRLNVGEAQVTPDSERIGRILSVAALQSLDSDPANTEAVIDALLSDPAVERCLAWVRLDLQQCVAAGHFKYEDSFCIAEHALMDVSNCLGVSRSAGQ